MLEVETKLIAPDAARLRPLREVLRRTCAEVVYRGRCAVQDVYLDTPDGRLRRAGYACRIRRAGGGAMLSLKALRRAVRGVSRREEYERPLRRGDEPSSRLPAWARRIVGNRPLLETFHVRNRRRTYVITWRKSLKVSVSADVFTVSAAGKVRRLAEVEVELLAGEEDNLRSFTRMLGRALGLRSGTRTKFEIGLNLAGRGRGLKRRGPRRPRPGTAPRAEPS